MDLTEEQWHLVQPLLPQPRVSGGRGRPALDQRKILNGILWKLRHRLAWHALPPRYGSHQACYLYYSRWKSSGLLKKIQGTLLKDLETRGGFDPREALRTGLVRIEEHGLRFVVYLPFPFSETWQGSTSLLYYQKLVELMEEQKRQMVRAL